MTPPGSGLDWRWLGWLLAKLLMDAALIDAAVETWLSGSPARWWVVLPVVLYAGLTIWALAQRSRLAAPGIVTQTPAAFYLFLGILGALTLNPAWLSVGVVMIKQPMPVVVTSTVLLIVALAVIRMATARGTPVWFSLVILMLGTYAGAALSVGLTKGTPLPALLSGHSEWTDLPRWLQGAYLGAVVLIPFAFARELIVSMKVLTLRGHLRWMVVFALGAWIVYNVLPK